MRDDDDVIDIIALEEVKIKETQIMDINKKIIEAESKLKQQQNIYETVRTERNQVGKQLAEAQGEIAEMKRKFKVVTHQIDQLKEESMSFLLNILLFSSYCQRSCIG